jgi:Kef-type K+ transport system membrane component KefB
VTESLVLVVLVAASYLAARVAFEWLAKRLLIVSGAEYLLLGILLGPEGTGLLTPAAVESFTPITTLALGWMGALIGTQYVLPLMVRIPSIFYRVAFAESLLTLSVVTAIMLVAFHWGYDVTIATALAPAVTLGAVATASAGAGVTIIARLVSRPALVVRQLQVSTATNAAVAVIASGLLLAIVHPAPRAGGRPLTPTEWAVITVGVGAVGGTLFHLFVETERKVDRLFISLAGAIILVSGAATYLSLSPLFAALCFGLVLANTSRNRAEIVAALERVERPLYFVLLVFAGATWRPSGVAWLAAVVLFLVTRTAAKIGGARLSARANDALPALGIHWGRGLLGQGGLALAIALTYLYQADVAFRNVVFTAAVASVLLTDLLSARFVRSLVEPKA